MEAQRGGGRDAKRAGLHVNVPVEERHITRKVLGVARAVHGDVEVGSHLGCGGAALARDDERAGGGVGGEPVFARGGVSGGVAAHQVEPGVVAEVVAVLVRQAAHSDGGGIDGNADVHAVARVVDAGADDGSLRHGFIPQGKQHATVAGAVAGLHGGEVDALTGIVAVADDELR